VAIAGGRFDLYHDYDALIRFTVIGGAGASAATLRIAPSAASLPVDVDLRLSSAGGELTLLDVGSNCQVDANFATLSSTIAPGWRYFELSLTKAGKTKVVKTGCAMIRASLAA
jgi:hypothetical protein